ncbi:hypothetical protein JHK87_004188 [Glycine soja]|nr:hypothetical protein JHK87_004188 [Glycine soja]
MAFHRASKAKPKSARSRILLLAAAVTAIALLFLFSSLLSTTVSKANLLQRRQQQPFEKYLYWGTRIDCPGKHCGSCEGLGHQESSLRCALEEALFLGRTFVMPSRMCINPIHNKKGILHHSTNASSEELWDASSCAMDSLYDTELMSDTVPVILDNSKEWYRVLSTSMKLGARGVAHVEGVSRFELKENSRYSDLLLINRTASPLSWFMECKDRNNRSAIMLPYSFLPSMAAGKLRDAAEKVNEEILLDNRAVRYPVNGFSEYVYHFGRSLSTTINFFPHSHLMSLFGEVKGQIREGNRTEISMPENGRNRDGCSPNIAGVTRKLVRNNLHPRILAAN